jgi:hypothetical protein
VWEIVMVVGLGAFLLVAGLFLYVAGMTIISLLESLILSLLPVLGFVLLVGVIVAAYDWKQQQEKRKEAIAAPKEDIARLWHILSVTLTRPVTQPHADKTSYSASR